jgi:hypothetical protein
VEQHPSRSNSGRSWHTGNLAAGPTPVNKRTCPPFRPLSAPPKSAQHKDVVCPCENQLLPLRRQLDPRRLRHQSHLRCLTSVQHGQRCEQQGGEEASGGSSPAAGCLVHFASPTASSHWNFTARILLTLQPQTEPKPSTQPTVTTELTRPHSRNCFPAATDTRPLRPA